MPSVRLRGARAPPLADGSSVALGEVARVSRVTERDNRRTARGPCAASDDERSLAGSRPPDCGIGRDGEITLVSEPRAGTGVVAHVYPDGATELPGRLLAIDCRDRRRYPIVAHDVLIVRVEHFDAGDLVAGGVGLLDIDTRKPGREGIGERNRLCTRARARISGERQAGPREHDSETGQNERDSHR